MAEDIKKEEMNIGEKLQSLPRQVLYLLLIIVASASILISYKFSIVIPSKPDDTVKDFFAGVMQLKPGDVVFVESDVTSSTRGESFGQLEALMRIIIRKGAKFAVYTLADAQAPPVAEKIINRIIAEEKGPDGRTYERWNDWISMGYFPSAEGTAKSFMTNLRGILESVKDLKPGSGATPVLQSPVLQNIKSLNDLALYINVTGSKTLDILVERLKFQPSKFGDAQLPTRMAGMCTGVMGPEAKNFYKGKQIFGLVIGLNGVVELETLMDKGLNVEGGFKDADGIVVEPFRGMKNFHRGMAYYLALHTTMGLMLLAIIVGNVGMFLARKGGAKK